MPWSTPTLVQVRSLVRDAIRGTLPGADATIANSVLRVLSDVTGAVCFLVLEYIDWLALQLLPDTAETVWLDRHANIWLTNSDGTTGRKQATLATGTATFTGTSGTVIPLYTQLTGGSTAGSGDTVTYETTSLIVIGPGPDPTTGSVRALDPGIIGNQLPGASLSFDSTIDGVDSGATVVELDGGVDIEGDEPLRRRVLLRIRQPPMGGSAADYVRWALAVPGVTRAWAAPQEQGAGTMTVRFMCDDLRASNGGFPLPSDVAAVQAYIDTVRPVTVKQCYVTAPIPFPCDVRIGTLTPYTQTSMGAIEDSLLAMFMAMATPGQTIFASWKAYAVQDTPGVLSFDLLNWTDDVMPSAGYMGTLGTISYLP